LQHTGSLLDPMGSLTAALRLSSHGVHAQQLQGASSVAPWRVGSSLTRDQTHIPCTARKILTHWTTKEAPAHSLLSPFSHSLFKTPRDFLGEGNGKPLQYSCLENPMDGGAWRAAVHRAAEGRTRLSEFTFTFHFHALEKEMATHSSVLAWRIPGTGEPGGLPSMGSHRVGHD